MSETEVIVAESSPKFLHQRKAGKKEIEETLSTFLLLGREVLFQDVMGLFYIK